MGLEALDRDRRHCTALLLELATGPHVIAMIITPNSLLAQCVSAPLLGQWQTNSGD